MKIIINKKIIDEVVEIVSRYSDPLSTLYGCRCILIEVNNEKIKFSASDNNKSIVKEINVDEVDVKVIKTGKILVLTNLFKNAIKKLENDITIESNEFNVIKISSLNTVYDLTSADLNTFPTIENLINVTNLEINTNEFRKAIRNVIFAAEQTESLVTYKCVHLKLSKNNIHFGATNMYRIGFYTMKVDTEFQNDQEISINSKDIKELLPTDAPKKVVMFFNNLKIGFKYDNTVVTCRSVDLSSPNFEKIFNTLNLGRKIVISKNELNNLLNRVLLTGNDKNTRIRIDIDENEIKMVNRIDELGVFEAKTSDFELVGDKLSFDLTSTYLKDAISVFEDKIMILVDVSETKFLICAEDNKASKQLITALRR